MSPSAVRVFEALPPKPGSHPGKGSRISAGAIATIRLLMLTGCRRNEILTLRWEHVDLDKAEMRIVDGKTGARTVHLSPSAVRVFEALPPKPGSPWVIPGAKPGTHMTDIDGAWASIRAQAGLRDVRIHDIRHSFASRALALGEGLPIIGRLLGRRVRPAAMAPRDRIRRGSMRTLRATRSGNPPSGSPSASPPISSRRFNSGDPSHVHASFVGIGDPMRRGPA